MRITSDPASNRKQKSDFSERILQCAPFRVRFRMRFLSAFIFFACACAIISFSPKSALAATCNDNCACVEALNPVLRQQIEQQHEQNRDHITDEFEKHEDEFWVGYLYGRHLRPMLSRMTRELSASAMQQAFAVGSFLDAQNQLATQRLLHIKQAEAHKDYQPSASVCVFGTVAKTLATAEWNSRLTRTTLIKRSQERQLNYDNSISDPSGSFSNVINRMTQFKDRYCNPNAEGGEAGVICESADNEASRDKDIDYTGLVDIPLTLDINFDNPEEGENQDGIDALALSANLFGHTSLPVVPKALMPMVDKQTLLLDMREVVAKRSVAESSLYSMLARKTAGSKQAEGNAQFMYNIMKEFGVQDDEDIAKILGERPSYYAQMEILTKKLYQNPSFYINLYDKPANVARKSAALRAVGLMQSMDRFNSQLRSEAILSLMLESDLRAEQSAVQNRIGDN